MPRVTSLQLIPALFSAGGAIAASGAGAGPAAQAAAAAAALACGLLAARTLGAKRSDAAAEVVETVRAAELRAAIARADAAERSVDLGRRVLARLPQPLLLMDAAGRVIYANPAAHTLFERLRMGEHFSMSFRNPDFLDALADALDGGPARSIDATLHGDRGRALNAHLDGVIAEGEDPRARHILCLFEDRSQAMQAIRMRTDFIANASHELRTPLASIRGFIETIQGPARNDPEARDRFLGIMQTQAERMQRLVDDLLSLNRIEMNQHVRPDQQERLGTLAREIVAALDPVARERGTVIEAADMAAGPLVRGDRDQLSQALGNLIENALKYGGGKPVRVFPAAPTADRPGMVGLTVADQGEGIARKHLPRLTERFYRVSVKRSRDQGGTGLGLAIVKHIMARHRGDLTIESKLEVGSAFTLWLPSAEAWETPTPHADR
ncbi:MAG: two-component system phosphate regulon sensor histidine kinase PhoR [Paracoccaceae bacterium]